MYTTKKVKCDKTPELDMLAHESGRVYCKQAIYQQVYGIYPIQNG